MEMLSQKAYDYIYKRIINNELKPGEKVSELALAGELGISRTPVGEAIQRLARQGLLEQVPRQGTIVRQIGQRDLHEIYQLREALESSAAAWAAAQIKDFQLRKLQVLLTSMRQLVEDALGADLTTLDMPRIREFQRWDRAFHMTIVEAADNKRMVEVVSDTRVIADTFRLRCRESEISMAQGAVSYHKKILEGLEAGDATAARRAMREHINQGWEETLSHFDLLVVDAGEGS